MEKRKKPQTISKKEITIKESPGTTAMKKVPDDVIVRAIREVLQNEKVKK